MPGARLLLVVRDGRDVTASYLKRLNDVPAGVERWLTVNRIVALEQDADNVLVVHYEDLVGQFEATVRQVCAFIGLPFEAGMLKYHGTPRAWFGLIFRERNRRERR